MPACGLCSVPQGRGKVLHRLMRVNVCRFVSSVLPYVYGLKIQDTCVDFEDEVVGLSFTEFWRTIHAPDYDDLQGDRYSVLTPKAVRFLVTAGPGREKMKDKCKNSRREQGKLMAHSLEKYVFGPKGPSDKARQWLGKDLLGETGESCTQA